MFSDAKSINFRGKKVKQIIRKSDNAILYRAEDHIIKVNKIDVSVVYENDNNNQDGNRPTEIPISLTVSREVIAQATLTAENNWAYTFSGIPIEDGFSYQIVPDRIDYYLYDVNRDDNGNFIITETYVPPERTLANVQIEFDDVIPDYRPETITATLNNGMTASLTQDNEWNATITNLSSIINHETAIYDWTISQIPHYEVFQKTKNGNITKFILKQLDNIPASITLEQTDGRQILSCIDNELLPESEFCELTATVMDKNNNPLSNIHVNFYQDGKLCKNISTNSNGQATLEYYSQGIGDVEIYAQVADLTTDSYIIEDCYYYNNRTYQSTSSSSTTLNKKIPSKCIITFENYVSSSSSYSNFITLGTNTTHRLGIGAVNSGEKYRFFIQDDASTPTIVDSNTSHPFNQWVGQTVIVDGNTVNYYNLTRTLSNTDLTNLWNINTYNGGIRNIKVKPIYSIDVDIDNPILSYADSTEQNPQIATLTATIQPVMSGKTIQIYQDDTLIAIEKTDVQGQVSYEYTSQGVGDVEFVFKCNSAIENYIIEDCKFYDDATSNKLSKYTSIGSPTSFTYDSTNKHYYLRRVGSTWAYVTPLSTPITTNDNIIIEATLKYAGMFGAVGLIKSNTVHLPLTYYSNTEVGMFGYGSTNAWVVPSEATNINTPLKIKYELKNGVANVYIYDNNGVLTWSKTNVSIPSVFSNSNLYLGVGDPSHDSTSNYIYFKDVKIKSSNFINIDVDNPILSYTDGDTATLTATVNPIVSGKTVKIYQDDVLVATETTDNQGQVSYEYTSQGIGDVEFKFKCGLVTENFPVQDLVRYDICDGSKTFNYVYDTTKGTAQYGTYGGSSSMTVPSNSNLVFGNVTGDFEVEFDYYPTNTNVWKRITLNGTNEAVIRSNSDSTTPFESVMVNNVGYNKWIHIKLTKRDTSLTLQVDNISSTATLKRTVTDPITVSINPNANCYYKNIKLKQLSSIDVDVDNPTLSYADSTQQNPQIATLTATVNPVASGRTVQIFKDDVLVATEQTDNRGQVSYKYNSQGVGDVEFKFKCNSVTKSYTIKDAIKYNNGTISSNITWNNIPLPINFKFSFKCKCPSYNIANGSNILIGTTKSVLFGQVGRVGNLGIFLYNNSSSYNSTYQERIIPVNVETEITGSYNNGVITVSANGVTKTLTDNTQTDRTKVEIGVAGGNYMKDLLIMPIESINIDVDNPILSYTDSTQANPQIATLTATVQPVMSGRTVQIYKDDVLIATEQTDNQGQVSYEYTSQGIGDVEFKFKCGLVTETYSITDAKYYADNTKINSYMSAYEGHQCAFIPYTVQYGDEVSFKFNTKPTHCLIGIGTSASSCLVMEFNTNQTRIHRSYGSGSNYNNNWLDTYSKIGMHMINLSSSEDRSDIYLDDVYYDYWRCQLRTNNNALRVEKFNNDDYNIEIIIL